jgi:hypothetical protein
MMKPGHAAMNKPAGAALDGNPERMLSLLRTCIGEHPAGLTYRGDRLRRPKADRRDARCGFRSLLGGPIAPDKSAVGTRWRPLVIDVTDC